MRKLALLRLLEKHPYALVKILGVLLRFSFSEGEFISDSLDVKEMNL
jgi:hypothetical protein